ncbi:hypothetical protein DFR65_104187 [Oceanihabitans sediminis]|uniref:Uncharacterized protein n=1 Tax=Oceanihabitans sediminis TaxID=1812012 RepID=A0A368P480_9FLAO|nr:hypothetical protein [Oceanihabitans sediminis]RBP30928.1 hypothetical protein DFR65_104187 [Oceanihabitans sediminis]RCU56884.1 hypothetical protein DU428_11100 [Oceanihabitans sediminis]
MKKTILLLGFAISIGTMMSFTNKSQQKSNIVITTNSDYCDGWEDGYCEGWKDVKGQFAVCPVTPVCPVPEVGKDGYRGGYNRGFKAGMKAARNN